ncbi:MAG: hypothetical protein J6S85_01930 [Methanobrevibacter sp.]|nr:hypothetical protein [Methanobrevibacter sp.]
MQYKEATKIVIDKRKLEILIRLNCPDSVLLEILKTGTFTPTGDKLIDDTLECLIDIRCFDNWGGARNGAGRPRKNQDEFQVENQDEIQDDIQVAIQDDIHLAIQVADKDRDNNNNLNNNNLNNNNTINKERKEKEKKDFLDKFEEFWKEYTPVKCNGRFVDKGSKKTACEKFVRILEKGEDYENIIRGTREYINHCKENGQLTCGATVFLNQERWKCDYGATINGESATKQREPRSILETYAEIAAKYQ